MGDARKEQGETNNVGEKPKKKKKERKPEKKQTETEKEIGEVLREAGLLRTQGVQMGVRGVRRGDGYERGVGDRLKREKSRDEQGGTWV